MCRQLTALALSALLTSCVTSSLVRPDFQLPLAQEVAFVSPVTTVAISRNFSPAVADKAATLESARLLRLALLQHRAELRLRNEVTIPDSLLLRARQEIYQAVVGIEERWQLGNRANLPVLDYLLAQQSQRYALLTVASGLTFIPKRSRPYLSGQPRLGGSLSGSVSSTTAGQPTSNIFLLLYDQQRHAFVYYRHTPPLATHEPLDAPSLEHDFAKLLKKDFRPVKQLQ